MGIIFGLVGCERCSGTFLFGKSLRDETKGERASEARDTEDVEWRAPITACGEKGAKARPEKMTDAKRAEDESNREAARARIKGTDRDHQSDVLHSLTDAGQHAIRRHVEKALSRRGYEREKRKNKAPQNHRCPARHPVEQMASADAADTKPKKIDGGEKAPLGECESVLRGNGTEHDWEDHAIGGVDHIGCGTDGEEYGSKANADARRCDSGLHHREATASGRDDPKQRLGRGHQFDSFSPTGTRSARSVCSARMSLFRTCL